MERKTEDKKSPEWIDLRSTSNSKSYDLRPFLQILKVIWRLVVCFPALFGILALWMMAMDLAIGRGNLFTQAIHNHSWILAICGVCQILVLCDMLVGTYHGWTHRKSLQELEDEAELMREKRRKYEDAIEELGEKILNKN